MIVAQPILRTVINSRKMRRKKNVLFGKMQKRQKAHIAANTEK
jgi:hypothetical protein